MKNVSNKSATSTANPPGTESGTFPTADHMLADGIRDNAQVLTETRRKLGTLAIDLMKLQAMVDGSPLLRGADREAVEADVRSIIALISGDLEAVENDLFVQVDVARGAVEKA